MQTITVQIHNPQALAAIQDLQKAKGITILDSSASEVYIPDWQQRLVAQRKAQAEKNPDLMLDWEEVQDSL